MGQQPRAALPRLRRHPPQPEGRGGLQRYHGAAARDSREDGTRDVSRPQRDGTVGRVLARLLQAGHHAGRNGDLPEPARVVRPQCADSDREPDAHDPRRQGARTAARRKPHRAHDDHRIAVSSCVGWRHPLLRRRRRGFLPHRSNADAVEARGDPLEDQRIRVRHLLGVHPGRE